MIPSLSERVAAEVILRVFDDPQPDYELFISSWCRLNTSASKVSEGIKEKARKNMSKEEYHQLPDNSRGGK